MKRRMDGNDGCEQHCVVVGGITHFGFRLVQASDLDLAVREAEEAGGRILRQGEFAPGFPFAYVADPDGYEIEIWFERFSEV